VEPRRIPPEKQTARIGLEKRPRGKVVTVIGALDPEGNDLPALAGRLRSRCGSGGTCKEGRVEIQGDHIEVVQQVLQELGYKIKRV
jgi:translation initiation factor 1